MASGCDPCLMTDEVEPGLVAEAESELSWEVQKSVPQKDLTMEQLTTLIKNLGPYNNTLNKNGTILLKHIFAQVQTSWLQETIKTTATAIIFLNIIRYFYKFLVQVVHRFVGSGELHIVLVGEGSFNNQVRPADWLIPGGSITDTILYSPWNCSIDAKVAYGIATGDLQPQHRDFWNNQTTTTQQQPQVPDHWNSIRAHPQQPVPEIILGPITAITADWITKIMALANLMALYRVHNRIIIPYPPGGDLAHWLPGVPLYQIIGVIAVLLKIIPPHKATIHLAADLKYTGATPPDVELLNDQYAYTPDGTVMTTQNMQFTDLEFPMLYGLLRTIFNPAPPQ